MKIEIDAIYKYNDQEEQFKVQVEVINGKLVARSLYDIKEVVWSEGSLRETGNYVIFEGELYDLTEEQEEEAWSKLHGAGYER